ncbi:hypothetical protein D3C81_1185910 [compost metagenome]
MLLGKPASEVINTWHIKYREQGASLGQILDSYNVHYTCFKSTDRPSLGDFPSGYILLTVPSLNTVGGIHQIIAEWNAEEGLWIIYDPQAGNEGKKYYAGISEQEGLAYPMNSYVWDAYISYDAMRKWYDEQGSPAGAPVNSTSN